MKAGITGLIDRPAEGAKEEGFAGFVAGMAKGIVGAVAAPVAGALGAVSRVTEGVDASTRCEGGRCWETAVRLVEFPLVTRLSRFC